ncbi:hypothetical protein HAX54_027312 [Datura stramonium]|uniref:START domain-containing protein n=1 Tax=Datura stramonium TaxID=4076 RepID=A0ABS8S8L8_DATST|nr:hypothetical protein [Datura stramonium]
MEGHSDMSKREKGSVNVVIGRSGEDENENKSISESIGGGASVDEPDSPRGKSSKKAKHNAYQIQELKAFFKENQTPNEKDRLELGMKLSLDSKQAEKLLGPLASFEGSHTFMMKNFELELVAGRNDIGGINVMDAASPKGVDFGKGLSSPLPVTSLLPTKSLVNEDITHDKSMLMNIALAALNELLKLANNDEPLWIRSLNGRGEILNLKEYAGSFIPIIGMKPRHFTTEATRASGIVVGNSLTLVETLMDKSRWVEMFPCLVGKTNTIDVISTGIGGSKDGALLLIKTELQIISDLVPVREIEFLRFCRKYAEDIWAIVDVSVDIIQEGSQQYKIKNCRRLPSGCIVQDMHNGSSKMIAIPYII